MKLLQKLWALLFGSRINTAPPVQPVFSASFDLSKLHQSGAIEPAEDHRDYPYDMDEIPQAAAPFDWNAGYDVEAAIGMKLSPKNQGESGSCGGQAISMYGQVLSKVYRNDGRERSAKFPYAQVFVPGGGSDYRSLANILIKQGIALETDTPSYQNGMPPSEAFMERPQDITAIARQNAAQDEIMMAYAFPGTNLDTIAQAISACHGAVILIHGSNNGTWLSTNPKAPTPDEAKWTHYVYAGRAAMRYGKKAIGILNSWGSRAGADGWQWLDEDYFNSGNILGAIVFVFNPKPTAPPKHVFNTDLKEGDRSDDVTALQTLLAYDGCFNLAPTGFYGPVTAQAVYKFQTKYQVADQTQIDLLQGTRVGPATRAKLNSMVQ